MQNFLVLGFLDHFKLGMKLISQQLLVALRVISIPSKLSVHVMNIVNFKNFVLLHLRIFLSSFFLFFRYNQTNWLTEKSDVYSFGIVLLEIITNRPVIDQNCETPHIAEWAGFMLTNGGIENIADLSLVGDIESHSIWKVLELALSCVNPSSAGRPNMSHAVNQLKECLVYENSKKGGRTEVDSKSSIEESMSSAAEISPNAR